MTKLTVKRTDGVEVKYLKAECGRCYWEDATVNGVEDTEGTLIPFRVNKDWCPTIDLETGTIEGWPEGTVADIHYKVCDAGRYTLLDAERNVVKSIDGYVPKIMCPEGNSYGDYVIMKVDGQGKIDKWKVDLSEFERDGDE